MAHRRFVIRTAEQEDLPQLRLLRARSLRLLARSHYDLETIESYLAHVATVDTALVADGTCLKATHESAIIGMIAWSTRGSGAGNAASTAVDGPIVRALFVDPDHARRGIARALLANAEQRIYAGGHRAITVVSTLNGVPVFRAAAFAGPAHAPVALPGGRSFDLVVMRKQLKAAAAAA